MCRKSGPGNLEEEAKESKKRAVRKENQASIQENKEIVL